LTLLPVLASATVATIAAADPPSATPPMVEGGPPGQAPPYGYALPDGPLEAPGMTPPIQQLDCENDPNWRLRPDCTDEVYWYDGGVVRGGFGGYFYGPRVYRYPGRPWGGGGWAGGRGGGGRGGGWGG
jgi:hypothetical protein